MGLGNNDVEARVLNSWLLPLFKYDEVVNADFLATICLDSPVFRTSADSAVMASRTLGGPTKYRRQSFRGSRLGDYFVWTANS